MLELLLNAATEGQALPAITADKDGSVLLPIPRPLKSPLAARTQIKAAAIVFDKLPLKRKSRAELLTASTAVQMLLLCR